MVYKYTPTGVALESAAFGGGRIQKTGSDYEINYFITDHLGNTRAVFNENAVLLSTNDYFPFGERINRGQASDNRYLYNGKEDQSPSAYFISTTEPGSTIHRPGSGTHRTR